MDICDRDGPAVTPIPAPAWQTPSCPGPRRDAAVLIDPGTALPIAQALRGAGLSVAAAMVPAASGDPYADAVAALDRASLIVSAWSHPAVDHAAGALVAARLARRTSAPGAGPVWIRLSAHPLTAPAPSALHIPLDATGAPGPGTLDALLDLAASDLARRRPSVAVAAQQLLAVCAAARRPADTAPDSPQAPGLMG
jgi:hypothetical protein